MDDEEIQARGNAAIEMIKKLAQETPDENLQRLCQIIDSLYRMRQIFKAAPPEFVTTEHVLISFDLSKREAVRLFDLLEGVPMEQVRSFDMQASIERGMEIVNRLLDERRTETA